MRNNLGKVRYKLITHSEHKHGLYHVFFGVLAYTLGYVLEPSYFSQYDIRLFLVAIAGSFIPDIDHLFYIYAYGRKKDYALRCRIYLKKLDIKGFINFVNSNHKHVTGIYSHNVGSLALSSYFTMHTFNGKDEFYLSLFFLAWTFHYIYDILEDILFFKKPNKNWFFIFNKG